MPADLASRLLQPTMASIREFDGAARHTGKDISHDYTGLDLNILQLSGPISGQLSRLEMNGHGDSALSLPLRAWTSAKLLGDAAQEVTPAMLEDDLAHYKELFSKLRFSYVEQVTKERYLRGIVGDPPLVIGHEENLELEAKLAETKADLKRRKEDVARQVEYVVEITSKLAKRHENLQERNVLLSDLPLQISSLTTELAALRKTNSFAEESSIDKHALTDYANMPPSTLQETLGRKNADLAAVDSRLETIRAKLELEVRQTQQIEKDLVALQQRKERISDALQANESELNDGEGTKRIKTEKYYQRMKSILHTMV
ncbi:hypothetical protein KEM54_006548 [Ascosphaera aggregata]|nr:hypothetical protein KEM54_006548 [Ascosphaera aggregata]